MSFDYAFDAIKSLSKSLGWFIATISTGILQTITAYVILTSMGKEFNLNAELFNGGTVNFLATSIIGGITTDYFLITKRVASKMETAIFHFAIPSGSLILSFACLMIAKLQIDNSFDDTIRIITVINIVFAVLQTIVAKTIQISKG